MDKGTARYKLIVATMMAGAYPCKSLDLVGGDRKTIWKAINSLKDAGYIYIRKDSNGDGIINRLKMRMFDKQKSKLAQELYKEVEDIEISVATSDEKKRRRDRIAEVLMMMQEAEVNVTGDSKPKPEDLSPIKEGSALLPYFITSLEARKTLPIKEDKGKAARFHGTLISDGGMYNIYNMGPSFMEWVRPCEQEAVGFCESYAAKATPWGIGNNEWFGKSAIIMARDMGYIVNFVKGKVVTRGRKAENGKRPPATRERTLVNINEYYDHTFYIPLSQEGQVMLNIMTRKKWHYYLTGLIYSDDKRADAETRMSVACDGIDNGRYGLVFLDGDIGRLKRFVTLAEHADTPERFNIICYDFQEPYVRAVSPAGVIISAVDFKAFTNAYFDVYEQFEGGGE